MRVLVAVLLTLFVLAPCAYAQSDAAPRSSWTDARVTAVAARRAPLVRDARAALDRAAALRVSGQRPPIGNPLVSVLALPGFPDYGAWTTGVSVGVPFEVSGVRGAYTREAEAAVRAARSRLADATLRAVTSARRARVELGLARALVDVQSARLATAHENERRVRARADARAATALEVALAERETALAEADLAATQTRASDALAAFRESLDLERTEPVTVGPVERPAPADAGPLDARADRAAQRRQDVVAFEHDAARFDHAESRAARSAVAPLVLGFEAQQVAIDPQRLGASIGASVRWELPLVQRAQGERAVLRAEAAGARLSADMLRRQVGRDVVRWAEALSHTLAEVDALEARAIPAAERLATASEASFAAGGLDYFRVLVARRELLELRARALDALRAAWSARLEYERALGGAEVE